MKEKFHRFYITTVGEKRGLERSTDLIFEELGNQTEFLRKNQADLHVQLNRLISAHEEDKKGKIKENFDLIKEIESLRVELAKQRQVKNNKGNKLEMTASIMSHVSDSNQDLNSI